MSADYLREYWGKKDQKTGETWLSFCQRTEMDAMSIAFGQAWDVRQSEKKREETQTVQGDRPARLARG